MSREPIDLCPIQLLRAPAKIVTLREFAEVFSISKSPQATHLQGVNRFPPHPALTYSGWAPAAKNHSTDAHWTKDELALGVPVDLLKHAAPLDRAWAAVNCRFPGSGEFHPAVVSRPKSALHRHAVLLILLLLDLGRATVGLEWEALLAWVLKNPIFRQEISQSNLRRMVGRHLQVQQALEDLVLLQKVSWSIPWQPTSGQMAEDINPATGFTVVIPGPASISHEDRVVTVDWDSAVLLALWTGMKSDRRGRGSITVQELESLQTALTASINPIRTRTLILETLTGHSLESFAGAQLQLSKGTGPIDLTTDVFGLTPGSNLNKVLQRSGNRQKQATP